LQSNNTSLILAKQQCTFIFDAAIMNEVIGGLLFDPNVECPAGSAPDDEGGSPKKSDVSFCCGWHSNG
jgi:hypothetical protein